MSPYIVVVIAILGEQIHAFHVKEIKENVVNHFNEGFTLIQIKDNFCQ